MDDSSFLAWTAAELAELASVLAVGLGGSRASGKPTPESDWDLVIYYRGKFDPECLRAKGWEGWVGDVGCWGGGIMNGGAVLTIDGRRVDVFYRDLDEIDHWCREAESGRFKKQLQPSYLAGIPTYVAMAELSLNQVLVGDLPKPVYPDALAREASWRWQEDARLSLDYAESVLAKRRDVPMGLANAIRGLVEAAHARLADQRVWVVNEKGMLERAGLGPEAAAVACAGEPRKLLEAVRSLRSDKGVGSPVR